eukprot:gene17892-biopygen2686
MVKEAVIRQGIEDERRINPCPLQAFADDVVVVSYDVTIINEMFEIGQVAMKIAGLEVKPSKCAVMYARRSGNNWYKGKADKKPTLSIQGNAIEVYPRDKSYKYLGKSLSLSGEDAVQVYEVIESYKDLLEKITSCKLPLALKASALNNLALAKILHHFYNTRFTEEQLELMEKSLVKAVRNMYDLYETTTQLIIFLPREHGGIGVKRLSDVYRSTRVAFLIKMLNHPQLQFKNIARQSLNLDMEKRKVASTDNDMNFLGFEISEDGYLNSRTKFGCQSDWPDLLRYARKLDVSIEFRQGKAGVIINGSISGFQFHANKLAESIITEYGDELQRITQRKPDIIIIDNQSRKCIILEVTVCYDLYFEQALNTKEKRYQPLCSLLQSLGWESTGFSLQTMLQSLQMGRKKPATLKLLYKMVSMV